MQTYKDRIELTQTDLLENEGRLRQFVARFLKFSGFSLYFPPEKPNLEPIYISEERRLLLPLILAGKFLGMAALTDVGGREIRRVRQVLPQAVSLILNVLALEKALAHDSQTGLYNEEALFARMVNEVEALRELFKDPAGGTGQLHRICFGMIVLDWYGARALAARHDHELCLSVFGDMAHKLAEVLPEGVIAAPLGRFEGRHEFGLLFPATGRKACSQLAERIMTSLESMSWKDSVSGSIVRIELHAGHSLYPQDMRGEELRMPLLEQAMRLRDRARYAAAACAALSGQEIGQRILAFNDILRQGGRINKILQRGRVRVNLGKAANAREGMRFNVLRDQASVGQLVLLETGVLNSVAEMIHIAEPGLLPEVGDRLEPMNPLESASQEGQSTSTERPEDKLYSHAEFLAQFSGISVQRFTLGISGINAGKIEQLPGEFFSALDELLKKWRQEEKQALLAGRYGSMGLIFFHPNLNSEAVGAFYRQLRTLAEEQGLNLASGLFSFPYLNYGRGEAEICALKALEYAKLLPEPHIGVFDSLALNISADKKYSLGDAFGAIEEYRQALLADPENAMARNSLGVCLAGIGKLEEARKMFEAALEGCKDNGLKAKICYNLGTTCQKEADLHGARDFYLRCLKLDANYAFAWLRLGQISESRGRIANARRHYERAAALCADDPDLANVAQRHLARIEARTHSTDTAIDLLHDALLRNPRDAASLTLLAQIYLDRKGDAVTAETLARRSVNLDGGSEAWQILARTLEAQGRKNEAETARLRGGRFSAEGQ